MRKMTILQGWHENRAQSIKPLLALSPEYCNSLVSCLLFSPHILFQLVVSSDSSDHVISHLKNLLGILH